MRIPIIKVHLLTERRLKNLLMVSYKKGKEFERKLVSRQVSNLCAMNTRLGVDNIKLLKGKPVGRVHQ